MMTKKMMNDVYVTTPSGRRKKILNFDDPDNLPKPKRILNFDDPDNLDKSEERQKKKQKSWDKLKNNPIRLMNYQIWRRQYLIRKKQARNNDSKIRHNIDESKQLNRFGSVRQGRRLSDIESRIERLEKELGLNGWGASHGGQSKMSNELMEEKWP